MASLPAAVNSLLAAGCPERDITVVDGQHRRYAVVASRRSTRPSAIGDCRRTTVPIPAANIGITEATRPFVLLMDADVIIEPNTIQRLYAAMVADRRVRIGSPIVVHASRPDVIQYAGGALHFICEAINPWIDRPLAERGAAPADIDCAPTCCCSSTAPPPSTSACSTSATSSGRRRRLHPPLPARQLHHSRAADALVRHHSRPRGTWLFYYQIRNRWHFMLKNYQWRTLIAIIPCLLLHDRCSSPCLS